MRTQQSTAPGLLVLGDGRLRHEPCTTIRATLVPRTELAPAGLGNTVVLPLGSEFAEYSVVEFLNGRRNFGRALLIDLAHEATLEDGVGAGGTPRFYLAGLGEGWWQPYTQVSMIDGRLVFVRLDGDPVSGDPNEAATIRAWVEDLGHRHRRSGAQLNNHQRWFVNAREDLEIEQKFTLPGDPNTWRLATATRDAIASGELDGWCLEPHNDFEQWDFANHMYAVTDPPEEAGYVAFIPAVNGSWIVRRKWFTQDAVVRREQLTEGLRLPSEPDLSAVVKQRFGVTPAWNAAYRRIRYNVMCESLATGHVFSVMFDRCIADNGAPDLHQVEVEYVRSRTLLRLPPEDDGLAGDFTELTGWTRSVLERHGAQAVEHDLSKLTWLRSGRTEADQ